VLAFNNTTEAKEYLKNKSELIWKNNWQNYSNHTIRNGIALVRKGKVNEKHRCNLFNELLWNETDDSSSIKNLIG
jgi:hypothetical protein